MELIRIREHLKVDELGAIVDLVKKGRLFIYPTDTVYGLGCDINSKNVERIFEIKVRPMTFPLSVAFSCLEMTKEYTLLDREQEDFIRKWLNQPYTFVVKKKSTIPSIVTSGKNTVGVRIPNNELVRRIIDKVGTPIVTTSANISGDGPPVSVDEIDPRILNGVELVIDAGPCRVGKPSKVIDLVEGKVVRE